ncbi:MAG: 23S rRNA (uracil(1939)-C(5))-methyltransferase RlmD [Planctomycetes bacterium]|nr:23S rRNA (uracil(1939)-C(5))-methyltransferase RlmD [Planctomycetota bacterium]
MELTIEDLNEDGRGRGHAGRKAVLVSQALPGERVVVHPDFGTRGTVQGRVARLIESSPMRVQHPCAHEFHCTGCALLAAQRGFELEWKQQKLQALLQHIAADSAACLRPMLAPTTPFHYRHYAKQVFAFVGGRIVLGSYVAGSHQVTDNRGCPVHAQRLQLTLDGIADCTARLRLRVHAGEGREGLRYAIVRQSRAEGVSLVVLVTDAQDPAEAITLAQTVQASDSTIAGIHVLQQSATGNALLGGTPVFSLGADELREELLGESHAIGPKDFFQVNPVAAEAMFACALEAAGHGAMALDLYAGVGAMSLPLARRFQRVHAVESNPDAAARLQTRCSEPGLGGLQVHAVRVEDALPRLLATADGAVAVCDPPRKGLQQEVTAALAASGLARIVLLACDPTALLRDLPPLLAGGFRLDFVQGVDQFPRTGHVEAVVGLERV